MRTEDEVAEGVARWVRLMANGSVGNPASQCGTAAFQCPCPLPGCDFQAYRVDFAEDRFGCDGCNRRGDSLDFMVARGLAPSRKAAAAIQSQKAKVEAQVHRPVLTIDQQLHAVRSAAPTLSMHEVDLGGEFVDLPEFIEGLVGRSELIMVSAKGGVGKTRLVVDMLGRLSDGRPFLGRSIKSRPRCLFVSTDMTNEQAVANIFKSFRSTARVTMPKKNGGAFRLDRPGDADRLISDARIVGAGVIAIDSYAASTVGLNEMDPVDVALVFDQLRRIKDATGATIIIIHHAGWSAGRARGHSTFIDSVDRSYVLSETSQGLQFKSDKNRNDAALDLRLRRVVEGKFMRHEVATPAASGDAPDSGSNTESGPALVDAVRTQVTRSTDHPSTKDGVEKALRAAGLKVKNGEVGKVVDDLLASGEFVAVGRRFGIPGVHDREVNR